MSHVCPAIAANGDWCDLGLKHSGPHIHFGPNVTHAWGIDYDRKAA